MTTDMRARTRRAPIGRRLPLAVVLSAAGLLTSACVGPSATATGEQVSSFSLPVLANSSHPISLSEYAGQPMIVVFWATWSPGSAAEIGVLGHFYRTHKHRVLIVGVDASDNRGAALRLVHRMRVDYPVASDPNLTLYNKLHAPGVPAAYFLDAQHEVVDTQLGSLTWGQIRQGVRAMRTGTVFSVPDGSGD